MSGGVARNWQAVLARARAALERRGRSPHEAEDLVQEAWVRLAGYEQAREPVAQPEAFLMRTALNLSIDAYRLRISHGEQLLVEDVVLLDLAPSVEAVVLGRERLARLSMGLARLSPKTRDVFLSHRLNDMSYEQIAARHGISISAVNKHIAKAMLQLTTWMEGW
ncbi:RNA polymerase sigma factor [Roseateles sp.]|uniref:RNA polymerase sigma factor n=1 Tax=Roseateles sp. TaxID=1971397 RepID=UPI003BACD0E8